MYLCVNLVFVRMRGLCVVSGSKVSEAKALRENPVPPPPPQVMLLVIGSSPGCGVPPPPPRFEARQLVHLSLASALVFEAFRSPSPVTVASPVYVIPSSSKNVSEVFFPPFVQGRNRNLEVQHWTHIYIFFISNVFVKMYLLAKEAQLLTHL